MKKTKPAPVTTAETEKDLCILIGEAEKINPHSTGLLYWEMTDNLDGERGLRITTNDSGGLFSREWIALSAISGVLKTYAAGDFTSTVLRPLYTSASRNNAGFLAAILRSPDICLTEEGSGGAFSHRCYPDWEKRLEKLLTFSPSA
ncbi:hypothetical protein RJ219_001863 [Enterobacter hormaechei]|uniref:hypothetical protein n=1 Tax=Enterobacter cloacae complex TaxID=354276 RepID=UPI000697B1DD|nr:hypothetical protein [Enterobacter hormaechei]EMC3654067.1 hypothetical protein [Citrobacter braakii]WBN64709.1 hypothetical protein KHW01_19460 [Enterobacter cloacae]EKW2263578.1 hypothetical protein [Enterobacter hormaechei]EKW6226112.1 hypothetical protein [Enterobacter hormaechei]EKW9491883.1 hypothetical protein [Enterobacter hormaechei]